MYSTSSPQQEKGVSGVSYRQGVTIYRWWFQSGGAFLSQAWIPGAWGIDGFRSRTWGFCPAPVTYGHAIAGCHADSQPPWLHLPRGPENQRAPSEKLSFRTWKIHHISLIPRRLQGVWTWLIAPIVNDHATRRDYHRSLHSFVFTFG